MAWPSSCSRVGVAAARHGSKRFSAVMPSTLRMLRLERSMTCFRSTWARNMSRGSVSSRLSANRRRYSTFATRLVSEKYKQSTPPGLQRPGRPEVYRNLGGVPSRKSSAATHRTSRRRIGRVGTSPRSCAKSLPAASVNSGSPLACPPQVRQSWRPSPGESVQMVSALRVRRWRGGAIVESRPC